MGSGQQAAGSGQRETTGNMNCSLLPAAQSTRCPI